MSERGHVIFAEDNEDFRSLLSEGLRFLDFHVSEAVDGDAALQAILSAEPPFVVLTDLHMPVASGYDLLARLERAGLLGHVRVVVLTAIPDPEVEGAVLLSKPIALEKLAAVLDEELRIAAATKVNVRAKLQRVRDRRRAP